MLIFPFVKWLISKINPMKGEIFMRKEIPFWEKSNLTIEEAMDGEIRYDSKRVRLRTGEYKKVTGNTNIVIQCLGSNFLYMLKHWRG